jgi:predicted NAD/FAD-binding protein
MKIAIIGSGIAGNVVAHQLHQAHDITVFESAAHIGGHTHTHDVELGGERHQIDTGFIVFNDWTYPNFIALLNELEVASQPSAMSFSVRNELSGLEYNGTSFNSLFAQRSNLLRPSFHRMIRDILRFNREAPQLMVTHRRSSMTT